jgi:hypothetical protein
VGGTHTLKGSLGSEVRMILNDTFPPPPPPAAAAAMVCRDSSVTVGSSESAREGNGFALPSQQGLRFPEANTPYSVYRLPFSPLPEKFIFFFV